MGRSQTHFFLLGLTIVLAAGFLSGCGREKNVDYDIPGIVEEEKSGTESARSSLAQFSEGERWRENWTSNTIEDAGWDGHLYMRTTEVHVDAPISVPSVNYMSVIEVEEPEFNEDYQRELAGEIFDSADIYYGDLTHLPRRELETLQTELLSLEQKEILEQMDMTQAKDTWCPVEAYDTDTYVGSYGGHLYQLSFTETGQPGDRSRTKQILFEPRNLQEVCPEVYQELDDLTCMAYNLGNLTENECLLSKEDAEKEARLFVDALGLDYSVVSRIDPLVWGDPERLAFLTGLEEQEDWGVNGYVVILDLGLDGISFVNFGMEENYSHYFYYGTEWKWLNIEFPDNPAYSLNARLTLFITDQGIIRMEACSPMVITGVSEGVGLLPVATVKDLIKESLNKNWKQFRMDFNEKFFDELGLIYFRVRDQENPNQYSYVPVWRLATVTRDFFTGQFSVRDPILINAIDGSIVDFYAELYDMQPAE